MQLIEEYGAVHVINLLGTKENEVTLTTAYTRHLQVARGSLGDDLDITPFDFHNAVRLVGHDGVVREIRYMICWSSLVQDSFNVLRRRIENVVDHIDRFGFTMCDATSDDIITDQKGVFRTNCLDW